jgi:hypothetical protein
MKISFLLPFLMLSILAVFMISCAQTKEIAEVPVEEEAEESLTEEGYSAFVSISDLEKTRNTLAEPFLTSQSTVATVFELSEDDLRGVDSRSGFRIQLLSTEDMAEADKVSLDYYDWAVTRRLPYDRIPESYVLFRQPNYRVRVGDFQTREQAIRYLNILRPHFPGAWIVMDTINPDLAP